MILFLKSGASSVTDPSDLLVSPHLFANSTVGTFTLTEAKNGNQWALNKIHDVYRGRVQYWVTREGLSGTDCDDIGQNVFVSILKSLHHFTRNSTTQSLGAWIRKITDRRLKDHYRQRSREGISYYASDQLDNLPRSHTDECELSAHQWSLKVQEAMNKAKSECELHTWQAFYQTVILARNPRDVAADLEITMNTVYLAKSRLLKRLRELLEK